MEVDLFGSRDGVMSSNSNSRLSKNNTTSITNIIYISLHCGLAEIVSVLSFASSS